MNSPLPPWYDDPARLAEAAQRLCDAYADWRAIENLTRKGVLTDWARVDMASDALLCALQDTRSALDGAQRPHPHVPLVSQS